MEETYDEFKSDEPYIYELVKSDVDEAIESYCKAVFYRESCKRGAMFYVLDQYGDVEPNALIMILVRLLQYAQENGIHVPEIQAQFEKQVKDDVLAQYANSDEMLPDDYAELCRDVAILSEQLGLAGHRSTEE